MERDLPPAPWLRRLPSGVWTVVTWCAAGLLALLLFASTTYRMASPFGLQPPAFAPALGLRAALAVVLALAVGWARRWSERVFGVLLAESVAVVLLGERAWPLFLAMGVLVGYFAAVRPRWISVLAGVTELAVGISWISESRIIDSPATKQYTAPCRARSSSPRSRSVSWGRHGPSVPSTRCTTVKCGVGWDRSAARACPARIWYWPAPTATWAIAWRRREAAELGEMVRGPPGP
ncbi:hypothetical protein [Streptomyces sp. NPDC046759]|uniref:hypothetical protein n=1 Tax=Streptomyces sp. NPDC046759 TaxID=3155019 RepID=UPI0034115187